MTPDEAVEALVALNRAVRDEHAPTGSGGPLFEECEACGTPWPCAALRVADLHVATLMGLVR